MAKLRILCLLGLLLVPTRAAADPVDRWGSLIRKAASRFRLPPDWIRRVIKVESDGATTFQGRPIVSSAGAMGLMQLMPGTWRDMRALLRLGTDPFDPKDNIMAGSAYLKLLYDRFGYPGLFAAYNAGPARYAASLSIGRSLPPETRTYIRRIGRNSLFLPAIAAHVEERSTPLGVRPGAREPFAPQAKPLFVQLVNSVVSS